MTNLQKSRAARQFIENWQGHGYEKGESQKFWIDLLTSVFGVSDIVQFIFFEEQVKDKIQNKTITNFIDAYIPSTRVMIEHKSSSKDLLEPIKQSDGTLLTPFQQAKKYVADLPFSQHPKWIITCNFNEFLIYDMENPSGEPQQLLLKELEKKYHLLQFLVDQRKQEFVREEEISLKAGELVGKLYDVLFPQYIPLPASHSAGQSPMPQHGGQLSESQLRSLNILCVRIVFCLYAEDAGLFETKTAFEDYIKSFAVENLRKGIIDLFRALDTKIADRDKYDVKLQPFPYVNGGLFRDEQIEIPNFTQEIADVIVNECAPFNWSEISPTIFGAVFESTLNPETRRKGGMHYTSIANIHKVIDPLFLDDLNAEFEEICGVRQRDVSVATLPQHDGGGTTVERKSAVIEPVEMTNSDKVVSTSSTTPNAKNGDFDTRSALLNHRSQRRKNLSPKERTAALHAFQQKLGSLKFLDPACGSGNFLTETYLSLRRLENRVISILNKGEKILGFDEFIKVHINRFYGIEINDFAVTVAKTALWIAESQMVAETEAILSQNIDFLPLTNHANIIEGNSLRLDWATLSEHEDLGLLFTEKLNIFEKAPYNVPLELREPTAEETAKMGRHFKELNVVAKEVEYKITPKSEEPETIVYDYIIGNPPFVGYGLQSDEQKSDTLKTYADENGKPYKTAGKIDYVANWYFKAARLIQNTKTRCAFVSTNSITQGEQVAGVWKPIFERFKIHFDFAYQRFKWGNETSDKAHMASVHCVIIGFSHAHNEKPKRIFVNGTQAEVAKNISPYLRDEPTVWIENRAKPLCDVPRMTTGNRPADGGHLIIEGDEYEDFIKKEPNATKWIKKLTGAYEYINGKTRYCLWLMGASPAEIKKMPLVYKRVQACREDRLNGAEDRQKLADTPALFRELKNPESYIIVPATSSERRKYIPLGFLGYDTIPTNSAVIIPEAGLYEFGILTSCVHMDWMRAVAGRLEVDYRYSKDVVYNNFPWCKPTEEQKAKIEQTAQGILDARAKYPDSSLAELYDETLMPADLRCAHRENDKAVMAAYGFGAKMSESEIVSELFKMYAQLAKATI